MDKFSIETAQNIKIKPQLAGISQRIIAYLIDMLVMIIFYLTILFLMNKVGVFNTNMDKYMFVLVLSLPIFLYYPILQYWNNGQTIGKKIMKIRVIKIDNTHPRLLDFIIRWVFRMIEVDLIPGLGLIFILTSSKNQRLGDLAAKTTVISERKKISINQSIYQNITKNYTPIFSEVQYLNDKQIQLIKDIYEQSKDANNEKILQKLITKIEQTYHIKKPLKMNPSDFIETLIKDYNYFSK